MVSVVYMVAGMSSRFGGRIKQFAKVGPKGETLIEVSIAQAIKAGFNKIVFIVGEKTEQPFKEMFGDSYKGIPIKYAKQTFDPKERTKPWGTTDAILSAKDVIDEPFVVCNGDDIYGEEPFKTLYNHFQESTDCATIGYTLGDTIPEEGTVNRGIFKVKSNLVSDLKEVFGISKTSLSDLNLDFEDLCSMNIFGLTPETLILLNKKFTEFKEESREPNKECLLPVELNTLIKEGKIRIKIYPTSAKWFGVTNPDDEEIVRKQLSSNSTD